MNFTSDSMWVALGSLSNYSKWTIVVVNKCLNISMLVLMNGVKVYISIFISFVSIWWFLLQMDDRKWGDINNKNWGRCFQNPDVNPWSQHSDRHIMYFLSLNKNIVGQPLIHRIRKFPLSNWTIDNNDITNLELNYFYAQLRGGGGGFPVKGMEQILHISMGIAQGTGKSQTSSLLVNIISNSCVRKG